MASLTAAVPVDLIRNILDLLLNGNVKETISYALVSKQFLGIVRAILRDHVTAIRRNPLLKHFYGPEFLNLDIRALVPLINYSRERYGDYYTKEFFYFFRMFLFSEAAPSNLYADSVLILKNYLRGKLDQDLLKLVNDKILWFSVVYEYAVNNLDNLEALALCSRYFGYPERLISFLVYTVPQNMDKYLIPYEREESERLIKVMKKNERLFKLAILICSMVLAALPYLGYLSVHIHKFHSNSFLVYFAANILIYLILKCTLYRLNYNNMLDLNQDSVSNPSQ